MADYWLDSNVFIEAKNHAYAFDLVPGFWLFIEEKGKEGIICASSMVYDELVSDTRDELAAWAKARRNVGLFADPDQPVQEAVRIIGDFVINNYNQREADKFLRKADPFVIAHALIGGGAVVTHESKVDQNSTKVKIPNICEQFNVECIDPYTMLRALNASFR